MRKLHSLIKSFVQGYITCKWQRQALNPTFELDATLIGFRLGCVSGSKRYFLALESPAHLTFEVLWPLRNGNRHFCFSYKIFKHAIMLIAWSTHKR